MSTLVMIKNGDLYNPAFVQSFNKLMKGGDYSPKVKLCLVKLRKQLMGHWECIEEVAKPLREEKNEEQLMDLMNQEQEFMCNKIKASGVVKELSPDDILNLENFLSMEE